VYDCKWARGHQRRRPEPARRRAGARREEEIALRVAIVVFDARRSAELRLDRSTARHDETRLVALESLDELAEADA